MIINAPSQKDDAPTVVCHEEAIAFGKRAMAMSSIELECAECGDINEIVCDGDNPLWCPSCRSVDCFKEVDN